MLQFFCPVAHYSCCQTDISKYFVCLCMFIYLAGNHQICRLGNQQQSLHCQWDQPVRYHRGDMFENVEYVEVCLH